jgi:hypothetical protein
MISDEVARFIRRTDRREPALPSHRPTVRVPLDPKTQEELALRFRGRRPFCPECGFKCLVIDAAVYCLAADCFAAYDATFGVAAVGRVVIASLVRTPARTIGETRRVEPRPSPPFDPSDYERPPRRPQ